MKSFKVQTTGKDMVADIVIAGYGAGMRGSKTCPECESNNLNEAGTICFDCQSADYLQELY
jgi:hypothetical protein